MASSRWLSGSDTTGKQGYMPQHPERVPASGSRNLLALNEPHGEFFKSFKRSVGIGREIRSHPFPA